MIGGAECRSVDSADARSRVPFEWESSRNIIRRRTVDESQTVRGSDDEYCSEYPPEPHHYVAHKVNAPPIAYVDICGMCGHISSRALRKALEGE
jgi:hypothetical protein